MPRVAFTLTAISLLLHSAASSANLCSRWAAPTKVGTLDSKKVPEASGLIPSLHRPGYLYWVNDSGNKDRLIFTDLKGHAERTFLLNGTRFRDTEALASAPCGADTCLIVADTGDNYRRRKSLGLAVFRESDLWTGRTEPFKTITLTLSGGARDIEAVAALPGGDLILVSKELSVLSRGLARVFRLPRASWQEGHSNIEAPLLGTLPIGKWLNSKKFLADAVTDAAFNSKREVLGLLTYSDVIEIPFAKLADLSRAESWVEGVDYAVVKMKVLSQQETMTYLPGEDVLLWSSESYPPRTPIYSMVCLESAGRD